MIKPITTVTRRQKLKALLFALILASSFAGFSATPPTAHASDFTKGFICLPNSDTNAYQTNVQRCLNNIYIFSIGLGGFVSVLLFVVAGYLYMSGEKKGIDEAKSIIQSTVIGLALLFGIFIILNFIDPGFTRIPDLSLPNIACQDTPPPAATATTPATPTTPATATTTLSTQTGINAACIPTPPTISGSYGGTPSGNNPGPTGSAQDLAKKILTEGGILSLEAGTDCPPNGPQSNLQAAADGKEAQTDGPGTQCGVGTTPLGAPMLQGLQNLADQGLHVKITSISSGHHSSLTDPHYQGRAVDLQPASDQQTTVALSLYKSGASVVALECNLTLANGSHYYVPLSTADPSKAQSGMNISSCHSGISGYHLHAQW